MEPMKRQFYRILGDRTPSRSRRKSRYKPYRAVMWAALGLLFLATGQRLALAQTSFQHPGVLVSRAQLDFVKAQVNAQDDPIYSAFLKAQNSRYGSLTYAPQGPPPGGVDTLSLISVARQRMRMAALPTLRPCCIGSLATPHMRKTLSRSWTPTDATWWITPTPTHPCRRVGEPQNGRARQRSSATVTLAGQQTMPKPSAP